MKLLYKRWLFWFGMIGWFYLLCWEFSFLDPDGHIPFHWYYVPNFIVSLILFPNILGLIIFGWTSFKDGWEKFFDSF